MSGIVLALAGATTSNLPAIGSAYGGGYFAGQISTAGNGIADYNLVCSPVASGFTSAQYRTSNLSGDPTSVINGPTNSAAMNDANHPAAQFCEGLTIGGFSDWYLPAVNELQVVYENLKPTAGLNNTGSGINPNSVPARTTPYATYVPTITSATNFQQPSGAEAFSTSAIYWQSNANATFTTKTDYFSFTNGYGYRVDKTNTLLVRALRRVAV